jgi:hypothetical protein
VTQQNLRQTIAEVPAAHLSGLYAVVTEYGII